MKRFNEIKKLPAFTPREEQVFDLLLEGRKAREIGRRLKITDSTVNYFVKNIYKKLGVNSKPELILRYAAFRQENEEGNPKNEREEDSRANN